ncbi:hypothetical protein IE077_003976, partial [Cardiosporidium cionae]
FRKCQQATRSAKTGGKKKPLKAPKKDTIQTEEDAAFKKEENDRKRKEKNARNDLLAKSTNKKK